MKKRSIVVAIISVLVLSGALVGCSEGANQNDEKPSASQEEANQSDEKLSAFQERADYINDSSMHNTEAVSVYTNEDETELMELWIDTIGSPSVLNFKYENGKWSPTSGSGIYYKDFKLNEAFQKKINLPTVEEFGQALIDLSEEALRDSMYDPGAAKIENPRFFAYDPFIDKNSPELEEAYSIAGNIILFDVNGKNRLGGYVGERVYAFVFEGSSLDAVYNEQDDKNYISDIEEAYTRIKKDYPCFVVEG